MSKTEVLTIDMLGAQGDGIAHHDEQVFYIGGVLPNEKVQVSLSGPRATLLHILEPSPKRIDPSCSHFPICGGCRVQELNITDYSAWKFGLLERLLKKENLSVEQLLPITMSPPGSRRRARLGVEHTRKGIRLGFNQLRSHNIIDLQDCATLTSTLVTLIKNMKPFLADWLPLKGICDIQLTQLGNGIDMVLIGGPPLKLAQREALATLAEKLDIAQLSWRMEDRSTIEPVAYRQSLSVSFNETSVSFPPGNFLQATQHGEASLIDFTIKAVSDSAKVLDLFCGLGGFGLSLHQAKQVTLVDLDGPAIANLGQAVKQNKQYQAFQRDLLREPFSSNESDEFDAIIFDPPRGGAKAQAEAIANSEARNVIAISCEPTSFVRDAKILQQGGYKLQSILPVDQFLWSAHLELAAHFQR